MWYGTEILSHAPGAMRHGARQGSMPLLYNHNRDDLLGIVEKVEIGADRRGYAQVRFGNDERGDWALQQVANGVLVNVSFMYRVFKYTEDVDAETFMATDWEPYEISLVTVPADASVGIGRSLSLKGNIMQDQNSNDLSRTQRRRARLNDEDRSQLEADERARTQEIRAMCRAHNLGHLAEHFVNEGFSVAEARSAALEENQRNYRATPVAGGEDFLGMEAKDASAFSIVRGIRAALSNDWSKAGLERAASRAIAQQLGRDPAAGGFFVPQDTLTTRAAPFQTGAGSGTGASLVATNLLADSFIDLLRNKCRVFELGATILSGLVGNIDIPRQTGAASSFWVAESAPVTEAEGTFDKVSLSPKTVGAINRVSRNMLLQSTPAIELLIRMDLASILAIAIDRAALLGTGSGNTPVGVLSTEGIGSVIGGDNGATLSFDRLIDLHANVMAANADRGNLAFMVNPQTLGFLSKLKATTGQYLWPRNPAAQNYSGMASEPGATTWGKVGDFSALGFPLAVSNHIPSNLTKGSSGAICSAVLFGNWSDLLIGEWGVLEIIANPYDATGFMSGDVLIRAMQSIDVAVRHPYSFAAMTDAKLV